MILRKMNGVIPFLLSCGLQFACGQCLDTNGCAMPADSVQAGHACKKECAAGDSCRYMVAMYKDGTYEGESPEWTGMKVRVTLLNGRIDQFKILEVRGTPEYYEDVVRRLPKQIINRGTLEVDDITGATLSSQSLKNAIKQALEKAVDRQGTQTGD